VVGVQSGEKPQRRPLNRQDAAVAEQMVERAAELARDSHARTRHAAVLVKDASLIAWGTNGVPFPGEDHCYCKFGELGHHDLAAPTPSSGRSRWPASATAGRCCPARS
jgi:hypothetical protein